MNEIFCMHCFAILPAGTKTCPSCWHAADDVGAGAYQEKLVNALQRPLAEVRLRAIIAIGLRHDKPAVNALVTCALRHPVDIVEGLQIIETLKMIDNGKPDMLALHYLCVRLGANAVKNAAQAVIKDVSAPLSGQTQSSHKAFSEKEPQ